MLNHRQRLNTLDGIRGIAIVAVCMFHLYPGSELDPIAHLAHKGWMGVDLFFVLSGFLITGILFDTRDDPHVFRNFYARRALRLLPLYLLLCAIFLVGSVALGTPFHWGSLAFLLYGANVMQNFGHGGGLNPAFDVSYLWSLALEEQFYLLWPLVVVLCAKRGRILRACLIGAVTAVALRWAATLVGPHFLLRNADLELPFRLDSLLSGGTLAMLLRSGRGRALLTRARLEVLFAASLLVIVLSYTLQKHVGLYGPTTARYIVGAAALGSAALIALALRPGTWAAKVGSFGPLRWMGRYSYGIYLLHFPLAQHLDRFTMRTNQHTVPARLESLLAAGAYMAAVMALAWVSYHALELPCLRLKRFFAYADEAGERRVQVDAVDVATAEATATSSNTL